MKNQGKPEILSPCGSPEVLGAAIAAGADAVYLGGTLFNARMNAHNFDRPALSRAIDECHNNGVRVYVTLNTLVGDRYMRDALNFAEFLYNEGADALIVADLGLASLLNRYLPGMRLHASTQLSGHNSEAGKFLSERGFSRMVCARELSKENVALLCENSPIETELFVHGALCVCHSGQCLFSSLVGGRSGNRGECAQPCRLPYNSRYPLSLRDNCLAGHVEEILSLGVSCLKIEGRMKGADYVYSAVRTYRTLIDEGRNATPEEIAALSRVFSRSGFTDGYFTNNISPAMLGVRTEENKTESSRSNVRIERVEREISPILTEKHDEHIPKEASNMFRSGKKAAPTRSARFYIPENIPDGDFFDIVYLPLDRFTKGKANGVILPPVITDREIPQIRKKLEKAKADGALHALVGNVGHISLAREAGFILHGDFRLNVESSHSMAALEDIFEDIIISPELTAPQIRDIPGKKSVIVYGRVPLMLLEKRVGTELLRDRRGVNFPVINEGGRDIILNSVPLYMADRYDVLDSCGAVNEHYIFTCEKKHETEALVYSYKRHLATKKEVTRIKK